MKEPQRPYQPNNKVQEIITKKTILLEQEINERGDYNYSYNSGAYDNYDLKPVMEKLQAITDGKNMDNLFIQFKVKEGYYDDKRYSVVISEITTIENPNYQQELADLKNSQDKYALDMAEYHEQMKKYWEQHSKDVNTIWGVNRK